MPLYIISSRIDFLLISLLMGNGGALEKTRFGLSQQNWLFNGEMGNSIYLNVKHFIVIPGGVLWPA